jgi:DNA-directed RNA polymerase specialized sigma24 family protein
MDNDLTRQADALLADEPQDPEYPFYLEGVARRRAEGRGRSGSQYREIALSEMVRALHASPAEQVERVESVRHLLRAANLTMAERATFLLSLQFGMTDEEIGELLGRHQDSVLTARKSARRKLQEAASEHGLAA